MNRQEFLKELYVQKNYSDLVVESQRGGLLLNMQAELLFQTGYYSESAKVYKKLNNIYKVGYCYLHEGNVDKADLLWSVLEDESSALFWGKVLVGILMSKKGRIPTYFQIRNFAEIDLSLFLKNKKFEFVHKIIATIPMLEKINPEIHKFVGSALLNSGYTINALNFLEKWRQIEYNDPEVHILLAKCYSNLNLPQKAKQAVNDCLNRVPDYFPAINFFNN